MTKGRWIWLAALVWLSSGCCNQPELFKKVQGSMAMVQGFYDPLIQENLRTNKTLQQAVVAADTTLLLAGELQRRWCPNPGKVKQLELQAQTAKQLAQDAGVVEEGAALTKISMKGSE